MQDTKKDFTKSDLSIFISYMLPHKKLFALDMFLSALIAFIDLSFPYITRKAMNSLLPQKMYAAFFAVMAAVLAAYLLRAFFQYKVTVIGHGYGTLVEADMRSDVFAHMQRLSYSFFDRNRTGVLLGRVTNDLFEIVELAHHGPENILTCSLTIVGALIILLFINPRLTLVLLVLLPVAIYCTMRQRLNMRRANREVKKKTGEINAAIESGISGIRTSKAFANEQVEEDKFEAANENFRKSKADYYKAMGLFMGSMEATIGLMQAAVIAVGGIMLMNGTLNLVDLLTFTCMYPLSRPLCASWPSSWKSIPRVPRAFPGSWKSCGRNRRYRTRRMPWRSKMSKAGLPMTTSASIMMTVRMC